MGRAPTDAPCRGGGYILLHDVDAVARAYKCPLGTAKILFYGPRSELLDAVWLLGPDRVQWLGSRGVPKGGTGRNQQLSITCWGWAGKNRNMGAILEEARRHA